MLNDQNLQNSSVKKVKLHVFINRCSSVRLNDLRVADHWFCVYTFWVWDQVHAQAPDISDFYLTYLECEHTFKSTYDRICQLAKYMYNTQGLMVIKLTTEIIIIKCIKIIYVLTLRFFTLYLSLIFSVKCPTEWVEVQGLCYYVYMNQIIDDRYRHMHCWWKLISKYTMYEHSSN